MRERKTLHSVTDGGGRGGARLAVRVSIQDVAQRAGVSTATVSRVLNSPDLVSPATATRVRDAIDALNYRPNAMAKALMTRRSNLLGITLPDIHGEFYMDVLHGADDRARALGYQLLVNTEPTGRVAGAEGEPNRAYGFIDGIAVMLTEPNPEFWAELRDTRLPIVALDADPSLGAVDTVRIDNAPGSLEAVRLLLATGEASRCVFVGGPEGNYDSDERERVFREALAAAGERVSRDQVRHGTYTVEWGRRWAEDAADHGRLRGAGVFAANDEIALGVVQIAQASGMRVPEDVRVIGFDDTRLAEIVTPSLSTVGVPRREFGAAAVELLVRRIEEPDAPVRSVRLPTRLVERASTRRAR